MFHKCHGIVLRVSESIVNSTIAKFGTRISIYVHLNLWCVITHPCPNIKRHLVLTKTPWQMGDIWTISSHRRLDDVITHQSINLKCALLIKEWRMTSCAIECWQYRNVYQQWITCMCCVKWKFVFLTGITKSIQQVISVMLYAAVYSKNTPRGNYEILTFVSLSSIESCEVIKIRNTVSISFWYHICAFVSWCISCCAKYYSFIVLCGDFGMIFRWQIDVPNRPVIDSNVTLLVLTSFSKLPAGPKVSAINYIHMLHMPLW